MSDHTGTVNCVRPHVDGGVGRGARRAGLRAVATSDRKVSMAPVEVEGEPVAIEAEDGELRAEDFGEAEEGRAPKLITAPCVPSRAEVEEHEVTHWPFRAWCPDFVRGRGLPPAHRRVHDYGKEDGVPTIVGDYCYMSRSDRNANDGRDNQGKPPILVIREVRSGSTMAMAVPCNGDSVQWAVDR